MCVGVCGGGGGALWWGGGKKLSFQNILLQGWEKKMENERMQKRGFLI